MDVVAAPFASWSKATTLLKASFLPRRIAMSRSVSRQFIGYSLLCYAPSLR